jgi:hypothetical protein
MSVLTQRGNVLQIYGVNHNVKVISSSTSGPCTRLLRTPGPHRRSVCLQSFTSPPIGLSVSLSFICVLPDDDRASGPTHWCVTKSIRSSHSVPDNSRPTGIKQKKQAQKPEFQNVTTSTPKDDHENVFRLLTCKEIRTVARP